MNAAAVIRLAALQADDGSFPSEVTGPGGTWEDRNGFTTARVLRALRDVPGDGTLDRLRARALAFVARCRSQAIAGAFGFWPEDGRPLWASRVPADVDDTAIMTVELLRHARMNRIEAMHTVCTVLLRNRVVARPGETRPPWIADGAFLTWIGPPGKPNVVDCCVNANAAALMGWVRATHLPGYQEAVHTIRDGLEWAGGDPARVRSLTPFYPSIDDLHEAVEHAVECGADALAPALGRLRGMAGQRDLTNAGCCSSAYGATVWHCQALVEAQALRFHQSGHDRARGASCRTTDTLTSIGR